MGERRIQLKKPSHRCRSECDASHEVGRSGFVLVSKVRRSAPLLRSRSASVGGVGTALPSRGPATQSREQDQEAQMAHATSVEELLQRLVSEVQPRLLRSAGTDDAADIDTRELQKTLLELCDQAKTQLNSREQRHVQDPDEYRVVPVARAPMNVFAFEDSQRRTVGWRNVFRLPVEYNVLLTPDLFDLRNTTLLPDAAPNRRLLVIDSEVHRLHGQRMLRYFKHHNVDATVVLLPGEEHNKRFEAVEKVLAACEKFGLRRREPLVAIGGGVLLDIVGMAANMYRRGVPFIRVPTTLLAIVDASVGVKNGVDYCSACKGVLKNRIGSFYAPIAAYADKSFIATQDERNIVNGLGEIMKLALVRSVELFELLEAHGARLVAEKFQGNDGVADRVIHLSIEIMLEELGPNLWEHNLERCVDYGHTFSKILEMQPGADLMHGEAVNIDGFICVLLAERRQMCTTNERDRILRAMTSLALPTHSPFCTAELMWTALEDAIEHRHGQMRVPLITGIGSSVCVNDISYDELVEALEALDKLHEVEASSTSCSTSSADDLSEEEL